MSLTAGVEVGLHATAHNTSSSSAAWPTSHACGAQHVVFGCGVWLWYGGQLRQVRMSGQIADALVIEEVCRKSSTQAHGGLYYLLGTFKVDMPQRATGASIGRASGRHCCGQEMARVPARQLLPLLLPLQQAAQLGAVGEVRGAAQQQPAVLQRRQGLRHSAAAERQRSVIGGIAFARADVLRKVGFSGRHQSQVNIACMRQ